MVGDTENLAPVPSLAKLKVEESFGPEQPARAPVVPTGGLSANDAEHLFSSLFPGLMATEAPNVVHPGLPEEFFLQPSHPLPSPLEVSQPLPVPARIVKPFEQTSARSRNSLFNRRFKPKGPDGATGEVSTSSMKSEEPVEAPKAAVKPALGHRTRNSLFSRRQKPGKQVEVESGPVEPATRVQLGSTEPTAATESSTSLVSGQEGSDRVTEATRSLFQPRHSRFRPRVRPGAPTPPPTQPTTEHKEHSFKEPQEEVTPSPASVTTTLPPVTKRKGFMSFLKSRSRSSVNGGRQTVEAAPRLPKPEPRIPAVGGSPPPVPGPLVTPSAPTLPQPARQVPSLLDLARDFTPTQPPTTTALTTRAPVTEPFQPTTRILQQVPLSQTQSQLPQPQPQSLSQSHLRPQLRTQPQPRPQPQSKPQPQFQPQSQFQHQTQFQPKSQALPNSHLRPQLRPQPQPQFQHQFQPQPQPQQPRNFRPRAPLQSAARAPIHRVPEVEATREVVIPAFLQQAPQFSSAPKPRGRNLRPVPSSSLPRQPHAVAQIPAQLPAPVAEVRVQGQTSPVEVALQSQARTISRNNDVVNKHKVVMQARSQLKPFLPQAENEGDALEKLRARIESLQGTNRHRGRG